MATGSRCRDRGRAPPLLPPVSSKLCITYGNRIETYEQHVITRPCMIVATIIANENNIMWKSNSANTKWVMERNNEWCTQASRLQQQKIWAVRVSIDFPCENKKLQSEKHTKNVNIYIRAYTNTSKISLRLKTKKKREQKMLLKEHSLANLWPNTRFYHAVISDNSLCSKKKKKNQIIPVQGHRRSFVRANRR